MESEEQSTHQRKRKEHDGVGFRRSAVSEIILVLEGVTDLLDSTITESLETFPTEEGEKKRSS
ncbi:hypothetical protein K2173_018197 [Erythroxylum novogranatense]|uniref:Uncharacterized protein n=1 Tax=Erythroxylum novogranatense TaxID=1862640 RepID=A0AAV8TP03_9ROSI|nr:hypothetical protein K2173_018197 [Erythroxylum novogranatense]